MYTLLDIKVGQVNTVCIGKNIYTQKVKVNLLLCSAVLLQHQQLDF